MNKFFYYFNKISIIILIYLFGFLSFKFDFKPKAWLNSSINLFIEDLKDTQKNFLLKNLKKISENENSDEFQYFVNKNLNLEFLSEKKYNAYMLLSLSTDDFNESNFGLYASTTKKVHSWSFENTIKPKVLLKIFPNGSALVYNDKYISLISSDSKEIWKLKKIVHHWGSVVGNKLYIPGRKFANYPEDLDENSKKIKIGKCKVKNSRVDTILVIDLVSGSIIKEIEILPIISSHLKLSKKIGYSKKIFSKLKTDDPGGYFDSLFLGPSYCDDLTHLNDIKILKKQDLNFFKDGKVGDFLLSLHTMNALILVDHEDLRIKWYLRNEFRRQHSPNITQDGMVLIFDNKGSNEKYGKSRLLKYDLTKKEFNSYFDGNNNFFFESGIRGRVQVFNGEIYVTSSQQGEVFKLKCNNKDLKQCKPELLFASYSDQDPPISIFVADFYSKNYFEKNFLKKISNLE